MLDRRFALAVITLSLFVPSFLNAPYSIAAAPAVHVLSLDHPDGVYAVFTNNSGCLETLAIVSAFNTFQQEPTGAPERRTAWIVFLDQTDTCTGTQLSRAYNFDDTSIVPTAKLDIRNDLRSAHFVATLLMTDELSAATFTAALDLTWTCTTTAIPYNSFFHEHKGDVGDYIINEHQQSRDQVGCPATGMIINLASNFNYTPQPTTDTFLTSQHNGVVDIYFTY